MKTLKPAIFLFLLFLIGGRVFPENPFLTRTETPSRSSVSTHTNTKSGFFQNPFFSEIAAFQKKANQKTSSLIKKLKKNENPLLFFNIILIVFIYGIIHALGPGHGKSIISAWILQSRRQFRGVLLAGALAGFFHSLSAVIIITASWFFLKKTTGMASEKMTGILQTVAGVLLILIGLITLVRFFLRKKRHNKNSSLSASGKAASLHPVVVAFTIGLVPCPVSSVILIFAISYGLLWEGVVFVMFFALGMIVTILAIGLTVWFFHKKIANNQNRWRVILFEKILPVAVAIVFVFSGLVIALYTETLR